MNNKKTVSMRVLAFLLGAVLLIGCSVGATLAWLVAKTDPVVNTFTVGNISLKLREHVLNADGTWQADDAYTYTGNNDIKMIPGRTIYKDPTVIVEKGSEDCYVRVLMKVSWTEQADREFAQFAYQDWFAFQSGWTFERIFDGSFYTNKKYIGYDIYELRYTGTVSAMNADVLLPIFTQMTPPTNLNNDQVAALQGCSMEFIAQAIQTATFADAKAAWQEVPLPDGYSRNVNP